MFDSDWVSASTEESPFQWPLRRAEPPLQNLLLSLDLQLAHKWQSEEKAMKMGKTRVSRTRFGFYRLNTERSSESSGETWAIMV